jgi:uracil-DNA glycosylase
MTQFDMFSQKADGFESLEDVIKALKRMKDDPLADAGTNVVISRGNPEAKLLIIGEAPGPEENIKGKPFVGRAGQMLDKVLQSADFDPMCILQILYSECRRGKMASLFESRPPRKSIITGHLFLKSLA